MDHTCAAKSIAPPTEFIEGVVVNANAQRPINEDCYTAKLGRAIAESENGVAWLILDRRMRNAALRKSMPGNGRLLLIHCLPALMSILLGSKKARSIEALARKCGLPEQALAQSIASYNDVAHAGGEDPLGKKKDFVKPITRAPFYALNLSTRSKTSPLATFTLGGLVVDEESGAVLKADKSPIAGLYAAGRAALGIPSNFYISGLSIADCVFSGRRAGRCATQAP
jgi:3-oxo-5alpha-steroid 4-dehydrogenase